LHKGVTNFTHGNGLYHMMLTIITLGVEYEDVLFSKNGFSSEVKELDDENLMLLTNEDFSSLLDGLSEKDFLVYKNKKY